MKQFKEILVCVIGATPQIITETIYALAHKNPSIYINEIFIITTSTGKKQIEETLIKKGILKKLIKEYKLPSLEIKPSSIIVIKDRNGKEIDDIRNSYQSEATADTIISLIKGLTKDSSVRLHCSLAGGRKTMGFYLGSAMELFARPWDKLYHVLVSSEFESNPDFFYKPKREKLIQCRLPNGDKVQISTEKAKIELIELPFIKLAGKIKLYGNSFTELIEETQSEINLALIQPFIKIKLKERKISIGTTSFSMNPILIAIYATILKQKILCTKNKNCSDCDECYIYLTKLTEKPLIDELVEFYAMAYKPSIVDIEDRKYKLEKGISPYTLRSYITKINTIISKAISEQTLASLYKIKSIRRYGATTYGVSIDRRKIKIE